MTLISFSPNKSNAMSLEKIMKIYSSPEESFKRPLIIFKKQCGDMHYQIVLLKNCM